MKTLSLIGIVTNVTALILPPHIPAWLVINGVCLIISIVTYYLYEDEE